MSVTRFGDTAPQFGLVEETSGYVQDFNQKHSFDDATCEDHVGEVAAYAMYNGKWEGSFTVIAKTGGTLPSIATAVALANLVDIAKVIITERDFKPEQKGFAKYTFSFKAFDNITLS